MRHSKVPGHVCTAHDLLREPVQRAVTARLGEWHANLPLPSIDAVEDLRSDGSDNGKSSDSITRHFRSTYIWTVLQKWTSALPAGDDKAKGHKVTLQKELKRFFDELYREDQEHDNVYVARSLMTKACGLLNVLYSTFLGLRAPERQCTQPDTYARYLHLK